MSSPWAHRYAAASVGGAGDSVLKHEGPTDWYDGLLMLPVSCFFTWLSHGVAESVVRNQIPSPLLQCSLKCELELYREISVLPVDWYTLSDYFQ